MESAAAGYREADAPSGVAPPAMPTPPVAAPARQHSQLRQRRHFVLVHGAGHGAWCWYRLRRLLEDLGHTVSCPDLAGAGIEMSDPNDIQRFEDHNRPLLQLLSGLPDGEKVVLVGHSAGGLSLTHAIREFGDARIELAVYVAANMLREGFCTDQDRKDADPDLSRYGDVVNLIYALGPDNPPTSGFIRPQFRRELLYQLSPMEDSVLASMLLRPWPAMALSGARFQGGAERAGTVRRVYIKTMKDHILKLEQQEAMILRWPPGQVMEVDSDHSPFFSATEQLLGLLLGAVDGMDEGGRVM